LLQLWLEYQQILESKSPKGFRPKEDVAVSHGSPAFLHATKNHSIRLLNGSYRRHLLMPNIIIHPTQSRGDGHQPGILRAGDDGR
jgi:hypothetical protein